MKANRLLLLAIVVVWEVITSGFGVSEFIFPSPSRIWEQTLEYKEVILGHIGAMRKAGAVINQ